MSGSAYTLADETLSAEVAVVGFDDILERTSLTEEDVIFVLRAAIIWSQLTAQRKVNAYDRTSRRRVSLEALHEDRVVKGVVVKYSELKTYLSNASRDWRIQALHRMIA